MRRLVTFSLLCMPSASTGVPIPLNQVWIWRVGLAAVYPGVCGGLLLYPLTTITLSGLPPERLAAASSSLTLRERWRGLSARR